MQDTDGTLELHPADPAIAAAADPGPTPAERVARATADEARLTALMQMVGGQVGVDILQSAAILRSLVAVVITAGIVSEDDLAAAIAEARVDIFEESIRRVQAHKKGGKG
jgi:hypothetical protein